MNSIYNHKLTFITGDLLLNIALKCKIGGDVLFQINLIAFIAMFFVKILNKKNMEKENRKEVSTNCEGGKLST